MHPVTLKGRVDRLHLRQSERTLYLKLVDNEQTHVLRLSDDAPFRIALELTKPGDEIHLVVRSDRIEKFQNNTWSPSVFS